MSLQDFKFDEERNVAVFTVRQIFNQKKPVLYVIHEEEGGAWQFLTGEPVEEKDLMIVSLEEIINHDPTLNDLYDLPMGSYAERKFVGDVWIRKNR